MPHIEELDTGFGSATRRRLDALIAFMTRVGYADLEARLTTEQVLLGASVCRIAIVGEPRSGKSTLVNREFLAEDVLPANGGTAVPTEIQQGPERRMEVFPYLRLQVTRGSADRPRGAISNALSACESSPAVIQGPTPADIRRHTSAATQAARNRLAETTARVRLFLPAQKLEGRILVDTPGIGPLNRSTVALRYRVLPACDRILITPSRGDRSAVKRALFESPMVGGRDVFGTQDLAPWPEGQQAMPTKGPLVRAERMTAVHAALAIARCASELRAGSQTADERRSIHSRLNTLATELHTRQAGMLSTLQNRLTNLNAQVSEMVMREMEAAAALHSSGMPKTPSAVRAILSECLEPSVNRVSRRIATAVRSLIEHCTWEGRRLLGAWEEAVRHELGPAAVPDIPVPFAARAMEMIALARLNPFGILADILTGIFVAEGYSSGFRHSWWRHVYRDVPHRVEAMLRPVAEILPSEWDDDVNSRLTAVRQGISATAAGLGPERRMLLRETLEALEGLAGSASVPEHFP
jgi:hypothetical protein